jgi:heat shock protein HslJ
MKNTPNTSKIIIGVLVFIILLLAVYIASQPRTHYMNEDGMRDGDMMNGGTDMDGMMDGDQRANPPSNGTGGTSVRGANGQQIVTPMTPDKTPLGSTVWTWNNTTFTNKSATVSPSTGVFVIRFDENGKVNAVTDCNTLNGTYMLNIKNNAFKFSPLAGTKMACAGPSLETQYAGYLAQVDSYVISENHLSLNLANNAGTMNFTRKLR